MANKKIQLKTCEDAVLEGMDFISSVALVRESFENYGSFLICCFALIGTTSLDAKLRLRARKQARLLIQRWQVALPRVPTDASPDDILGFVLVHYGAKRLGVRYAVPREQIRAAPERCPPPHFLAFLPDTELPPADL